MKWIKVEDKEPNQGDVHVVKCWDWCESGYAVAEWEGYRWIDNTGRDDFHDYVTDYYDTPIIDF